MKTTIFCLVLVSFIVACSPQLASSPTSAVPTLATTPTRAVAPLAAAPTLAATSAPTSAFTSPAILQHFPLADLPGVGRAPYAIAMLGDKIYVADANDNLAVIQNDRVTKFIPVGKSPAAIVADTAQNRLYVATPGDKSITLITNDQVALTQNIGAEARALLFFDNRLFVGLDTKDGILVLDPATLQTEARIAIPNIFTVINLAGDPARQRIYADVYEKIVVIDATTLRVLSTFPVKDSYYTLLIDPSNGNPLMSVYDSASQSQFLTAFDPTTGAARSRVEIGGDPFGAAETADGTRVYVANSYTNDVSVVDQQNMSVVATITVGLQPKGIALDEKTHRLYVTNYDSDSLSAIDTQTNQVIATIPVGMLPTAITANESAGRVYVANASTDSVYVIEGARVVQQIPVGHHPIDLARDDKTNRLFVANEADRTLSIIDESNFSIRTTQPITRFVTTVAVDAPHSRLFVNDMILDLNTLSPIGNLILSGNTLNSTITPDFIRVNPNDHRIYALAWNGTPGSNSREVTYVIDGSTLKQLGTLAYYGNTSAFAIDAETNRVYMAGTHPLAHTSAFSVFDASDKLIISLPLAARTPGMVYNPQTHHLFLAHAEGYPSLDVSPSSANNTIQILDTNSFGEVARLALDSPGKMARLGNTIYVTNLTDGSITLIQDIAMPTPPSPTPTRTPTPYPTFPPASTFPTTIPPRATPPTCAIATSSLAAQVWTADIASRLGCPTETQHSAQFAAEPFERGAMFYRDDEKKIYVLFNDKTWAVFDDTWNASLPVDLCPSVTVAAGSYKPQRGFGKVWCEQSNVRAKLGAATAPEHGLYAALVQRFERGQIFGSDQPNQVFVLFANNTWE